RAHQHARTQRRQGVERKQRRWRRNDLSHGWSRRTANVTGANEAMQRRIYNAEFSRYLLAMILTPPPEMAVEYKYAGESEVEDAKADVIDVTGPDNFSVRVFFDKNNHL